MYVRMGAYVHLQGACRQGWHAHTYVCVYAELCAWCDVHLCVHVGMLMLAGILAYLCFLQRQLRSPQCTCLCVYIYMSVYVSVCRYVLMVIMYCECMHVCRIYIRGV